ncbi:hypothetical protein SEA_MILDRED21_221 [Streptomyces phage Mildred21]|uniref:DUF7701 domain-containing protein n=1 Tax=Streptomyces phage Mildred21 TaxID=2023959 RepID=A0A222YWJ9_9CAUD|nr:hypothetical protein FDI35_gp099 [Streptomyces phage Mildred21]ASR75579.1 hypothetical protein SEA_MILDRED21_221 [Streptomyces phage Mildred21]
MSNYVQKIKDALSQLHPRMDSELLDVYALLVLVKGEEVTLKDVHDAWSVWKNNIRPDHRSLIEFDELTPEVQALDQRYADSIETVAKVRRIVNAYKTAQSG